MSIVKLPAASRTPALLRVSLLVASDLRAVLARVACEACPAPLTSVFKNDVLAVNISLGLRSESLIDATMMVPPSFNRARAEVAARETALGMHFFKWLEERFPEVRAEVSIQAASLPLRRAA